MSAPQSLTQGMIDGFNVEQSRNENRLHFMERIGGIDGFSKSINLSLETGLTHTQILDLRSRFGTNELPKSPMESFFSIFIGSFNDFTLMVLIVAAFVSLGIQTWQSPDIGWIEGTAILIAVILVAVVTSVNDYTKELQFRSLEESSQTTERTSVLRDGRIDRINPNDLVVGDIIRLQAGDSIPADSVICDKNVVIVCNESSLTGESDEVKKSYDGDCFLISSCLITEGAEVTAIVFGVGSHSQWGKIKANLITESVNTPLQDKLDRISQLIGYVGLGAAIATFIALVISIWTRNGGQNIASGFIDAFILGVVIVVVAVPEGLPLAVTISLAYSTKKMYKENNNIRTLAACETMGNATNICSDKTGTLTENVMTVVESWFGDKLYNEDEIYANGGIPDNIKRIISENTCINRVAFLVGKDEEGKDYERPHVIGNKTEGALLLMSKAWGYHYEDVKKAVFDETRDRLFPFNSTNKRSAAVIHRSDGSVRVLCKGASEWLIKDCTMYLDSDGSARSMTPAKLKEIDEIIQEKSGRALRTLALCHRDFSKVSDLPYGWEDAPPTSELCLDAIVGIIDPLRDDVKEAVAKAQGAGVMVRMVTGDNIITACAIARECGILTDDGIALEGPTFRKMSPKEIDAILPKLQVLARSSPEDKYLLVVRLNGYALPNNEEEWLEKHKSTPDVTWEKDRDRLLPGYREEWEKSRPNGGDVVGVTGDGTNDAPALKAADVGLSMGLTGSKVAQSASDIVILDDKFSSIVRSIVWGRCVYDNIRKFLQFQLTVNVVALLVTFIGAVSGYGIPLNAVMMLWVNLVMDTMAALALGTEMPTDELLNRRPYKRSASLLSRPMLRFVICQTLLQLFIVLGLLFYGPSLLGVHDNDWCSKYSVSSSAAQWSPYTNSKISNSSQIGISCGTFSTVCPALDGDCYESAHPISGLSLTRIASGGSTATTFNFVNLDGFAGTCLSCEKYDYTLGSIIFNAFIFCQVFNEFNARALFNEINVFDGISTNPVFLAVFLATIGTQIFLIELGGDFVKTTSLTLTQWLITIALGAVSLIVGLLAKLVPLTEDPSTFSVPEGNGGGASAKSGGGQIHPMEATSDVEEEKKRLTASF